MRQFVLSGLLTMVVVGSAACEEKESPWIKDWSKARALAREQGKPILAIFR